MQNPRLHYSYMDKQSIGSLFMLPPPPTPNGVSTLTLVICIVDEPVSNLSRRFVVPLGFFSRMAV